MRSLESTPRESLECRSKRVKLVRMDGFASMREIRGFHTQGPLNFYPFHFKVEKISIHMINIFKINIVNKLNIVDRLNKMVSEILS